MKIHIIVQKRITTRLPSIRLGKTNRGWPQVYIDFTKQIRTHKL